MKNLPSCLPLLFFSLVAVASSPTPNPPPPPWEPDGKHPPYYSFHDGRAACNPELPPLAPNLEKVAWKLPAPAPGSACTDKDAHEAARRHAFDACCSVTAKKHGLNDPKGVKELRATRLQKLGGRLAAQAVVICGNGRTFRILIPLAELKGECWECGSASRGYEKGLPDPAAANENTHVVKMEDGPRTSPHGVAFYCGGTYWPKK